ncbi:MAG: hypothetical protein LBH62_03550 [Nitrososphaerota archaeon]|nr:hypothetical protein [Nitrososphaerota archaeon]
MKRLTMFVGAMLLLLLATGLIITCYTFFSYSDKSKSFYVGVTYCGNSVEEAKELVFKVKDYTNLFVLQSWHLQRNTAALEEIGDYVVASGLNYAVYSSDKIDYYDDNGYYYGISVGSETNTWANTAKERWQEHFIGIYYRDEPGGCLLDGDLVTLDKTILQINDMAVSTAQVTKFNETITVYSDNNTRSNSTFSSRTMFGNNGEITIVNTFNEQNNTDSSLATRTLRARSSERINYYPNGTITVNEYVISLRRNNFYTTENLTQYPWPLLSYGQMLKQNPIQTYDDAAKVFIDMNQDFFKDINKKQLNTQDVLVFTADYGLYWWDYKGGYDVVLAELAWNHSDVQQIGLVRGAANLQGKSWGTILTWKYTHPPYLAGGEEIFEQMKLSYETGAEYVLIFNYSENLTNPNILQEEHFLALERFWNDVVQNPKVVHGGVKAEAVLVLPKNYGWGMRTPNDKIWGLWPADNNSSEIWDQIQNKTDQYGPKLDIVFEDSIYSVAGKYHNIYQWNQK